MKALVYSGPGKIALEKCNMPELIESTDVIVRVTKTTICGEDIVAPGGNVANIGAHGLRPDLGIEHLWNRNIDNTTQPMETRGAPTQFHMPKLHRIATKRPIAHRFKFDRITKACDAYGRAPDTRALKMMIES